MQQSTLNVKSPFEANLYIRISNKSGDKFLLGWILFHTNLPEHCTIFMQNISMTLISPPQFYSLYITSQASSFYRKPNSISVLFQNFEPRLQKLNSIFLTVNVTIWFQESLKDLVTYAQLQLSHLLKLRMKPRSIIIDVTV